MGMDNRRWQLLRPAFISLHLTSYRLPGQGQPEILNGEEEEEQGGRWELWVG